MALSCIVPNPLNCKSAPSTKSIQYISHHHHNHKLPHHCFFLDAHLQPTDSPLLRVPNRPLRQKFPPVTMISRTCLVKSSQSHHLYECTIKLTAGNTPPHNSIYLLTGTENQAMEEYIEEAHKFNPLYHPYQQDFFFCRKEGVDSCHALIIWD